MMQIISDNYNLIFLGIVVISAIFALIRGGITEILSISSWFIALWLMHKFGNYVNNFIPQNVSNPFLRSVIIYAAIFILVAISIAILKKIFASLISTLGLGGLNYLLGFIFGILRGVFICAFLIIIIEIFNLDPLHNWKNSTAYPIIRPIVKLIIDAIPENIKNLPPPSKLF
ncbi:MAG: CvpA family protein [Proteobacteria bacterium]|nr:CvpA family protein [Pseudomonadota bacterium]